jgi:hypothetical protein
MDPSKWKAIRLIDERTGECHVGIEFPTRLAETGFTLVDEDWVEQPSRVRRALKKRGAAFEGTKGDQIRFTRNLLKTLSKDALRLVSKTGFHGDGFVLGQRMLGSANGSCRWFSEDPSYDRLGEQSGSLKAWRAGPVEIALQSSYLTFALCAVLAPPLVAYCGQRASQGNRQIVPETATFNFVGTSGSGKSTLLRAAAGLYGPPDLVANWQFTRRGFEEHLETRNDLATLIDDIETQVQEGITQATAIKIVTQVLPQGKSKYTSNVVAREKQLRKLTWVTFGLTGSPVPTDQLTAYADRHRTLGERVRFIDIPVPPIGEGGIFDRLHGTPAEANKQVKELFGRLCNSLSVNYGFGFDDWIDFLLEKNRSADVFRLVNEFVSHVAGHGDAYDARLAQKFGLIYAAGWLASKARILPWPTSWPLRAISKCYRKAYHALHSERAIVNKAIDLLLGYGQDTGRFPKVPSKKSRAIQFSESTLGVRTTYRQTDVLAIRDDSLRRITGGGSCSKLIIRELKRIKAIIGGHGRAGTTQLPITVHIAGRKFAKPRFWLIDLARLASMHTGSVDRNQ